MSLFEVHRKPQPSMQAETAEPHRWTPAAYDRSELSRALVWGRVAGRVTTHDRANVRWKLERLVAGDPDLQFGLTRVSQDQGGPSYERVLWLMAEAAGFDPDPSIRLGPTPVDPDRVLDACEAAGERLADAALGRQNVLLATGHPGGLLLLYQAVGRLLVDHGAVLLEPLDGFGWSHNGRGREIRYMGGVATYTSRADLLHTHSPEPMELMLAECRPDLVFADHGFAGAAIETGVDTISIVDVNDPAPVVARAQGRTRHVICMDDNVRPEAYWPCFQAMASSFLMRGAERAEG
jgi:hypothetical protein